MATSDTAQADMVPAIRRALGFAGGFLAGMLVVPTVLLAILLVLLLWPDSSSRPAAPFLLTTAGADISRAGGSAVEVERFGDVVRQECRGACDDLRLEDKNGELKAVRVLDDSRACITCRDVSQPYQPDAAARRWSVAGAPRLSIVGGGRG